MSLPRHAFALLVLLSVACGDADPPPSSEPAESPDPGSGTFRVFDRNVVFVTPVADTAYVVPWLFSARTQPGGVQHTVRAWIGRGTSWDPFYAERWETPPSRAPWRLLPHGSMRLVVGLGDAVTNLLYSEGQRALELEFGDRLMEWTGVQGEVIQLVAGALYMADTRVNGVIMDMTRNRLVDGSPPGDWAFLVSGDSLQLVLASGEQQAPGAAGAYRAWARLDFRDLQWPGVTVDWSEVRAYQPARQDVPVSWTLTAEDGGLGGVLQVASAHIEAGEGAGPLLPVDAVLWVTGTLRIEGATYPVRGLVRHTRP